MSVLIGGREYSTVVIGDLEWMSENLKVQYSEYSYPEVGPSGLEDYGLLYTYQGATDNIPLGWRLPTLEDFEALSTAMGGNTVSGKEMKIIKSPQWPDYPQHIATDSFGFGAEASGARIDGAYGSRINKQCAWWTSTHKSGNAPYNYNYTPNVSYLYSDLLLTYGSLVTYNDHRVSVRYIRDYIAPEPIAIPYESITEGDIKLFYDTLGYADTKLDPNGNVILDDGLENMVLISWLTDARADDNENIPSGQVNRQGWFGDALTGFPIGSKLWLLQRYNVGNDLFQLTSQYCKEALQWMIDDGIADDILVDTFRDQENPDNIIIVCEMLKVDNSQLGFAYYYNWKNQTARKR